MKLSFEQTNPGNSQKTGGETVRLRLRAQISMADDSGEGGAPSGQALRSHPRGVHQSVLLPRHVVDGGDGDGSPLDLVSQQEFQDLVVHGLAGHVDRTATPPVVQLQVGAVKEEEPGRVVAAVEGGEEERRLSLRGKKIYKTYKSSLRQLDYESFS